ncbi:hypothetical protein [Bacillus sp. FJAT-47783]|uniref:hypothetical protein n=1 Tax=Bacillus sp. FJAT-47783 TaxID=2922712 RepID=UPI001FADCB63|nr:hypothetical protein [Bacillus sp. FJAT-47783]
MQVISLSSLIEAASNEEEVAEYLSSSFSCSVNPDVEKFLHKKEMLNEKRSFTRTSLVIDEFQNNDIIGYFTLMIKPFEFIDGVSGSTKQKLTNDKHATIFNTILIAQLGRSEDYKGKVFGYEILQLALENCKLIYNLSGLRVVCVEYDDKPILNDFYLKNEFKILQRNESGKLLAYLRL